VTIGQWLDAREPQPPASLATRLREVIGNAADEDVERLWERFMDCAERLVADLISTGGMGRSAALDLLVADALATYAFERAAERPAELGLRVDEAMQRFGALATEAR
jgi:hypothetical protein